MLMSLNIQSYMYGMYTIIKSPTLPFQIFDRRTIIFIFQKFGIID